MGFMFIWGMGKQMIESSKKAVPGVVGQRAANQLWTAWNLLESFATERNDQELYDLVDKLGNRLEKIPGMVTQ